MEDGERAEKIDTFGAITGADRAEAMSTLSAFDWDLNRAINYFLETGRAPGGTVMTRTEQVAEDAGEWHEEAPGSRPGAADPYAGGSGWQMTDEDPELQRALAASLGAEGILSIVWT